MRGSERELGLARREDPHFGPKWYQFGERRRLSVDWIPPNHIQTVYHYTSLKNWQRIQRSGKLEPRTDPQSGYIDSLFLRHIPNEDPQLRYYWQNKHIVGGVDDAHFLAWREAGNHSSILRQVAKGSNELVLLSFPASVVRGAYIKEVAHMNPKKWRELFEIDQSPPSDKISQEIWDTIYGQIAQYHRSVVKGRAYDGSYQIPEIWIPHPINIADLTVEKIGKIKESR